MDATYANCSHLADGGLQIILTWILEKKQQDGEEEEKKDETKK